MHIRDWKQDGHRKRQVSDPKGPTGHVCHLVDADRIFYVRDDSFLRGPREEGEDE